VGAPRLFHTVQINVATCGVAALYGTVFTPERFYLNWKEPFPESIDSLTAKLGKNLVVPLDGKSDFGEVSRFANAVGRLMVLRDPDHLTQEFSKADRGDRILIDTGRNHYSATFAAPYAVRARTGAPVSAPCTWDEIEDGTVEPRTFTMVNMLDRLSAVGDLWSDMHRRARSLKRPTRRLRALL
jgi:bifunctional non-homologous end joining protein LigD